MPKPSPRCKKPTVAINEKKAHNGSPCKKGEERTKNFCVKQMSPYDAKKTAWVRTISPNKNTRIAIACPK
jgi:hypothetical protein